MDPLSVTASIIAILQVTATLVNYANDVKDAPKDRARFAMEASSLSSLLLNLRYQIEDSKSNEEWYREVILLGVSEGPLDQYNRELKKLQLKVASSKGLVKIGDALWWKFSKEEVASILLRIERLKNLIQIALQMDHFKLSQAIKTGLDEIYENSEELKLDMGVVRFQLPAIQDSVDAVQRDQERQKNQVLVEWISSAKYSSQQSDFIARREPGTGQWFLDSPEFKNLLAGNSHTLFCPGIPGAGKTMISAIVIDHLHTMAHSDRCGVAQIFCNYKTQSEQNTTSLLSAILKQLVQSNPSAAEAASSLYKRHSPNGTRPSLDDIFGALKTAMKTFVTVYLVVDALDECSRRDGSDQDITPIQFLDKLRDLQHEFDVRLMVTSRANPDIVNQFKTWPRLEIRARPEDVKRFVSGQVHRLHSCVRDDDMLRGEVEDKIVEAVDGMFLLARLHVDSLLGKRTKAKVQSILKMLPRGAEALDKTYDDAKKRLEAQVPDDSKLAKSVISWITYAERPLTTEELRHALAVDPNDTDLNKDNILEVKDIVSVCAGLVTVDEESNIVRLVHYTTQEYFLQVREAWNPTAPQEITTTCLTYLSFGAFRSGSCDEDKVFEERVAYYIFLEYASRYWGHHAQTVQEQVSELALAFLRNSKLVSCALQVSSVIGYTYTGYSQGFEKFATGVHLAAGLGLQYLLAGLLSGSGGASSMPADSTDESGRTPLSWAAGAGREAVVKLLLEQKDVEADKNDNHGQTPLSWAAQEGHEAIVKLFLGRKDVAADSKDERGRTQLSWAAGGGNEALVKLLLEQKDVEADKNDNQGRTPLSWAAGEGHEAIVKLLLGRKDVAADSKDERGRTPLSWAAGGGNEALVKLLLGRKDVEADTKYKRDRTPLLWAAQGEKYPWKGRQRHEAVIKLFLGRVDVDANSKDKEGQTPLSWAMKRGNRSVVELLLRRHDVDANVKDEKGRTPIMLAAQAGWEGTVKLLVEREDVGADLKDKKGRTPLMLAAQGGQEGVVELLVEREDVEADSKDNMGWTPLMRAAWAGRKGVVQLLLEREDVDPAAKDGFGRTALSLAEKSGQKEVIELLRLKLRHS